MTSTDFEFYDKNHDVYNNNSTGLNKKVYKMVNGGISNQTIDTIAMYTTTIIKCLNLPFIRESERVLHTKANKQKKDLFFNSKVVDTNVKLGLIGLDAFIYNLALNSRVQMGTLLAAIVYLTRLKKYLPKGAEGQECTLHRIFLAALITAGKYLNDSSPKNKYWARYSKIFTLTEVNLMEKQFLTFLNFDLKIDILDLNNAGKIFNVDYVEKLKEISDSNFSINNSRINESLNKNSKFPVITGNAIVDNCKVDYKQLEFPLESNQRTLAHAKELSYFLPKLQTKLHNGQNFKQNVTNSV